MSYNALYYNSLKSGSTARIFWTEVKNPKYAIFAHSPYPRMDFVRYIQVIHSEEKWFWHQRPIVLASIVAYIHFCGSVELLFFRFWLMCVSIFAYSSYCAIEYPLWLWMQFMTWPLWTFVTIVTKLVHTINCFYNNQQQPKKQTNTFTHSPRVLLI